LAWPPAGAVRSAPASRRSRQWGTNWRAIPPSACHAPTSHTQSHADFLIRRFRDLAQHDPKLAAFQPYKAAGEGDVRYFAALQEHLPEIVTAIAEAYAGITPEEFAEAVTDFMATARHPRFGVPYQQLTYAPIRELLAFLRSVDFMVFLVTRAGRDFARVVSEELYDVLWENLVGSSVELTYVEGRLVRQPKLKLPVDDGRGKPVHIFERLGRRPTLAIGNSDGDVEMLESALRYPCLP
jgi:hypothetical protein